jgi:RNA polymerase sigma-70 factor (family 1)
MRTDYSQLGDEQLLASLAESKEPAFSELYLRYKGQLFVTAVNFLHCENCAEDCLQDVFISIWVKRERLAIENLKSYLHQAVRFRAMNFIRQRKPWIFLDEAECMVAGNVSDSSAGFCVLECKELRRSMERIIQRLPDDQRKIFLMHREHQYTYPEIAVRLGISVKTVEKKMSMALRVLRGGYLSERN